MLLLGVVFEKSSLLPFQIEEATKYTKLALKYYNDHIHSLQLLVLLLTAQKKYQEALDLINASLEEYPDNIRYKFATRVILISSYTRIIIENSIWILWRRNYYIFKCFW